MSHLGWAILGYLAVQLIITFIVGRYIKSESDFLLAGRSLSVPFAAMSIFATWFGAETVMASAGAVAGGGFSETRAEPFGYALCLVLMGLLIATKMRARGYMTLADLYRERFSNKAAVLAVVLMVPTSLMWAAAQMTAFGSILQSVFGIEKAVALIAATGFVIVYTSLSGLLGDVVTDNIQGAVVVAGLAVMLVMVVGLLGGVDAAAAAVDPARLSLLRHDESWTAQANEWAIPIVGSLVVQEVMSRMLGSRDARTARNACFGATALYLTVGLIPVTLGLIGTGLVPVPEDTDTWLPALAQTVLPEWVYVLFIGALTAAILSTINSNLLAVSALIGHNLVGPIRPAMSDAAHLKLDRVLVVAAGLSTYFIAISGDSIYHLLQLSNSWGSAGLVVVLLAGLWTGLGGPLAALASLVTGVAMTIIGDHILAWDLSYLKALAACVIVFTGVGIAEKRFLASRQAVRTAI